MHDVEVGGEGVARGGMEMKLSLEGGRFVIGGGMGVDGRETERTGTFSSWFDDEEEELM